MRARWRLCWIAINKAKQPAASIAVAPAKTGALYMQKARAGCARRWTWWYRTRGRAGAMRARW